MTNTIIQYTKEQEKQIVQQIREIVLTKNRSYKTIIQNKFPYLLDYINSKNPILKDYSFATKVYWILNNLSDFPKCENPTCLNKITSNVINVLYGHKHHCCNSCAQKDPKTQLKLFNTKKEKYGDGNYNNRQKADSTTLDRYGVKNYSSTSECQKRIQKTKEERYGDKNYNNRDKAIKTTLTLYGTDNYAKLDESKTKIRLTSIKKYGETNYNKTKESKLRHKQTYRNIYGVDNPSQSKEIREKIKNTCIQHWGVENYTQTHEYHQKAHKPFISDKYPDLTFGSSWEFIVYDFLKEHNIEFEYQPAISIPYEYKGEIHTYHPDFLVNDKLIEVKGDQFFRINEKTGKQEMFCPWRYPEWTDEYYQWKCGLFEAKHQCMVRNGVRILLKNDIKNLTIQMFA